MDTGPGIPGWFVALFILVPLIGLGSFLFRMSVARNMARKAGLDEGDATAAAFFNDPGVSATYVASALRDRPTAQGPQRTAEDRLAELESLRDKGLISPAEYDERRTKILDSI